MKRWNGKRHCYECFGLDAPICEECFKPDPTFKGISARDSLLARVNATAKAYPRVEKELLKIENDARNGLLIKIQRGVTRMSIEATHRINRRYPMFAELHRFGVFDEPEAVRAIKIHMQAMQKNLVSYMENLCLESPYLNALTMKGLAKERRYIRIMQLPTHENPYITFVYSNSMHWNQPKSNKFKQLLGSNTIPYQRCKFTIDLPEAVISRIKNMKEYITIGKEMIDSKVWILFFASGVHPAEHLFEKYQMITDDWKSCSDCHPFELSRKDLMNMRTLFDQSLDMLHEYEQFLCNSRCNQCVIECKSNVIHT